MSTASPCDGSIRGRELLLFAVQVVRGRWFTVFASFLITTGAGATYLFGMYSQHMKASLGYDQTTLNLIGSFKDLGANLGVLSGLIAEVTPTFFVLLVGSTINFAGYFVIWLGVTGKIANPKVWQMCLGIFIGANSQNFAKTGALVTCVKNFPKSGGVMLGLLKGFVGLSGAVMTQFYLALYGNDAESLILLIAWFPAALSLVFVYTIRTLNVVRQPKERKVFNHFLYVSTVLALFLMAMTVIQKQLVFSRAACAASATVIWFMLFIPLFLAIREELVLWNLKKQPVTPQSQVIVLEPKAFLLKEIGQLQNYSAKDDGNSDGSCLANIWNKPERGEDYSILQALLSMDMFILFLATLCGLGSSLTVADNLGQIGESLVYPAPTVSSFASLVSIWNYFGRVFSEFVSEDFLVRYKLPRPLVMTLVLLLTCVGHLLIAFPVSGSVYVASIIIGFSFGAQLPLLFAIISELFGLKYYSTLFNCGQLASPLGSYILNVKVTAFLYDGESLKDPAKKGLDRSSVKELTCNGTECYRLSFIILASVTFFGAFISLILAARTRECYKGDIYMKFREDETAADTDTDT